MMMRSMCRPETEDRNSAGTHKPSYVLEVPIIPWENTFCESNEKTNDFDDSRLAIACVAHIGSGCVLATRFSPVHLVHLHKRRSNCTLTGLHFVCGRREWERKRERTWIPNRQNNNMNEWTNERQTKLTGQAVCAYPMCTMCIFFGAKRNGHNAVTVENGWWRGTRKSRTNTQNAHCKKKGRRLRTIVSEPWVWEKNMDHFDS